MTGNITPQFLNRLRERIQLSQLIGRAIKVTRAGREFKACCPFHKEKTPSFTINDQKGFYHCFGCGAHGDAVGFAMQYNNLSFPEAVASLASEVGLEVPKATPEQAKKFEEEKSLYHVMDLATKWFENQFWHGGHKAAITYMRGRGFTEELLQQYRVGFAPADWDAFVTAMIKAEVKPTQLKSLGLTKRSQRGGGKDYAFFRGRVMFPVTDRRGRVVAFGGRHLEEAFAAGDLNSDYTPAKYMNSPDNPLFHKGDLLFNLARSQRAAGDGKPLIVVEGYTDVMRISQAGIEGAVAPLGTALTEAQMQLMWRLQRSDDLKASPILCFDGDRAGQGAAWRALERALTLISGTRTLRFLYLPAGEDPDTLIRKGGAGAFQSLLNGAQSLLDTLWQYETRGRDFASAEERSALAKRLEGHINRIKDSTLKREYGKQINQLQYQTFRNTQIRAKEASPQLVGAKRARIKQWRILLAALINHPWLLEQEWEWLGLREIPDAQLEALKVCLLESLNAQNKALSSKILQKYLADHGYTRLTLDLCSKSTYIHGAFARTDASRDEVTDGWRHICSFMQDQNLRRKAVR